MAWSGSTTGRVTAPVLLVAGSAAEQNLTFGPEDSTRLVALQGQLNGKWILFGNPPPRSTPDAEPPRRRFSLAQLLDSATLPTPEVPRAPAAQTEARNRASTTLWVMSFLERERIAGLILSSVWPR